jgi:hypothetical protein
VSASVDLKNLLQGIIDGARSPNDFSLELLRSEIETIDNVLEDGTVIVTLKSGSIFEIDADTFSKIAALP